MENNVILNSNYNIYKCARDICNGPNGELIIACGTILATAMIMHRYSFKCDLKNGSISFGPNTNE